MANPPTRSITVMRTVAQPVDLPAIVRLRDRLARRRQTGYRHVPVTVTQFEQLLDLSEKGLGKMTEYEKSLEQLTATAFDNGAQAMKLKISDWLIKEGFEVTARHVLAMDLPKKGETNA